MLSRWNDADAARCATPLDLRVYTSRLLGMEPSLVLHGGGNTSVKASAPDLFGDLEEILYIKGSGWDLATIEAAGFAPVRLDTVRRMADLAVTQRYRHGARPACGDDRSQRPDAVGRGDPARHHSVCVRRPHPRRRRGHGEQHAGWRATDSRDLRRCGARRALRHAGVRAGEGGARNDACDRLESPRRRSCC